jgi:hypothetical protein
MMQRLGRTGRKRSGSCVCLCTAGAEVAKFRRAMQRHRSVSTSLKRDLRSFHMYRSGHCAAVAVASLHTVVFVNVFHRRPLRAPSPFPPPLPTPKAFPRRRRLFAIVCCCGSQPSVPSQAWLCRPAVALAGFCVCRVCLSVLTPSDNPAMVWAEGDPMPTMRIETVDVGQFHASQLGGAMRSRQQVSGPVRS